MFTSPRTLTRSDCLLRLPPLSRRALPSATSLPLKCWTLSRPPLPHTWHNIKKIAIKQNWEPWKLTSTTPSTVRLTTVMLPLQKPAGLFPCSLLLHHFGGNFCPLVMTFLFPPSLRLLYTIGPLASLHLNPALLRSKPPSLPGQKF